MKLNLNLITVFLGLSFSSFSTLVAQHERYNFTGLDSGGGVFDTSEFGEALPALTVSSVSGTGNNLGLEPRGDSNQFFRLIDGAPTVEGQTVEISFSCVEPTKFEFSPEGAESAINDADILKVVAEGVSIGFCWCAINLDSPNTEIKITTTTVPGDTITIAGNGQGSNFTAGLLGICF